MEFFTHIQCAYRSSRNGECSISMLYNYIYMPARLYRSVHNYYNSPCMHCSSCNIHVYVIIVTLHLPKLDKTVFQPCYNRVSFVQSYYNRVSFVQLFKNYPTLNALIKVCRTIHAFTANHISKHSKHSCRNVL